MAKAKIKGKGGSVTVSWNSKIGSQTRVYSEEVHGEDFVKLAEEFATKKSGTISE